MAGITAAGFVPKTLDQLKTELEQSFQTSFGQSIDVSPQSNFGQLIGVVAEFLADEWATQQGVYSAAYPDSAIGASLDAVCSLTGTTRKAAAQSTVSVLLAGTASTSVPSGTQLEVQTTLTKFATSSTGVLGSATAWASGQVYAAGTVRKNAGNIYYCLTAISSSTTAPTGTSSPQTDDTGTWQYICAGDGFISVTAHSVDTGPWVALSGTLNIIATPVAGLAATWNPLDATPGRNLETDEQLRLRRESELFGRGNATQDSIKTRILAVSGVTACNVFVNSDDVTDSNGVPPHSIECLVRNGTDAAIALAIFNAIAAGIGTYGSTSINVTDSEGVVQTFKFSRPQEVNIYAIANIYYDSRQLSDLTSASATLVTALLNYGAAQPSGRDVVPRLLNGIAAFALPGVLDARVYADTVPSPTNEAPVVMNNRQIAIYDSSRISINFIASTP